MGSRRMTAVEVGLLFIIATAAPLVSLPFTTPLIGPDGPVSAAAHPAQLGLAALLEMIMAIAIVAIAVLMHPILKGQSERVATGYLALRCAEGVIFLVVAVITLRLLLPLGRQLAAAAPVEAALDRRLGALLGAAHDEAYLISGRLVFSLSAVLLNYSLYRSKAIPRWLSLWGLVGAVLLLAGGLSGLLGWTGNGSTLETIAYLPIAVQEMVFAVWLIARGFAAPATAAT